ncbi:hypothetical protein V6K52_19320 [Knoellia sp. S7-12]|uniref:hypothetical protein n=1 Tax=Knoellia sp. S7-12 TaxID=3126698 RepID=UPI00336861B6
MSAARPSSTTQVFWGETQVQATVRGVEPAGGADLAAAPLKAALLSTTSEE